MVDKIDYGSFGLYDPTTGVSSSPIPSPVSAPTEGPDFGDFGLYDPSYMTKPEKPVEKPDYDLQSSALSFLKPIAKSGPKIAFGLPEMAASGLGWLSDQVPEGIATGVPLGQQFLSLGRKLREYESEGKEWRPSELLNREIDNLVAGGMVGTPDPFVEGAGEVVGTTNEFAGLGAKFRRGLNKLGAKAPVPVSRETGRGKLSVLADRLWDPTTSDALAGAGAGLAKAADASEGAQAGIALALGLTPTAIKGITALPGLARNGGREVFKRGLDADQYLDEALTMQTPLKGKTLQEISDMNLAEKSSVARQVRDKLAGRVPHGDTLMSTTNKSSRKMLETKVDSLFKKKAAISPSVVGARVDKQLSNLASKEYKKVSDLYKKFKALGLNKTIALNDSAKKVFFQAATKGAKGFSLDASASREAQGLIDNLIALTGDDVTKISNLQMKNLLHGTTELMAKGSDNERRILSQVKTILQKIAPDELLEANKANAIFASKYKLTGRGQNFISEVLEEVTKPGGNRRRILNSTQVGTKFSKLAPEELVELEGVLGAKTVNQLLQSGASHNLHSKVASAVTQNKPEAIDDLLEYISVNKDMVNRVYGNKATEMSQFLRTQRRAAYNRMGDSADAGRIGLPTADEIFPSTAPQVRMYGRGGVGAGGMSVSMDPNARNMKHLEQLALKALLPKEVAADRRLWAEPIPAGIDQIKNSALSGALVRMFSPSYRPDGLMSTEE